MVPMITPEYYYRVIRMRRFGQSIEDPPALSICKGYAGELPSDSWFPLIKFQYISEVTARDTKIYTIRDIQNLFS